MSTFCVYPGKEGHCLGKMALMGMHLLSWVTSGMEFHPRDYIHIESQWILFFHSSSQCTIHQQENVASSSCHIEDAFFLNSGCHRLLPWELVPCSSWEEDKMLSACCHAYSLSDRKMPASRAHFTGETVTRGAPTITLMCVLSPSALLQGLVEQGCHFPSCMAMQSALSSVPFSSLCYNCFNSWVRSGFSLKLYSTKISVGRTALYFC